MLPGEDTSRTGADDVLGDRFPKILLVDALLALPKAPILNGLHPLAIDRPDLAGLPDLVDPIYVCIVEGIENPPYPRRGNRKINGWRCLGLQSEQAAQSVLLRVRSEQPPQGWWCRWVVQVSTQYPPWQWVEKSAQGVWLRR